MIGRREFVVGAAAAGVLMQPRLGHAKASQPATKVNFDIPAGACDCHTHIHGDPAKFPWFAGRTYTPEMALPFLTMQAFVRRAHATAIETDGARTRGHGVR